jgi:hypothetical protein
LHLFGNHSLLAGRKYVYETVIRDKHVL